MYKVMFSLLLTLLGCRSQQAAREVSAPDQTPIAHTVLDQGQYCGIEEAGNVLIRDAEAWATLWQTVAAQRFPVPPQPAVDFSRQVVVASFMGMQRTGGHGIRLDSLHLAGDRLSVGLTHIRPGRGCMVTEALTQPYLLLLVEAAAVEAHFEVAQWEEAC
jgi:hypothetical protein